MGRYRVIERLGRGGMGQVWLAEDASTGARVALKRPHSAAAVGAARAEVAALRLLGVPGVVPLLDEGEDEEGPYLVTARVEGAPFPGPCRDAASLTVLAARLLEVLSRIHAAGVLHLDLKPGNVLVDADHRPWVLDFGLSERSTGAGASPPTPAGTPRYLAPEQLGGGGVDVRTDLYAVGLMLFEALAGRAPVQGQEAMFTRAWRDVPPIRDMVPEVPTRLATLIDRLCARLPSGRPDTASAALFLLGYRAPTPTLAFLGSRAGVEALVAAARAGRSLDVRGPSGGGRTRLLDEAVAELVERRVVRLKPGTEALSAVRSTFALPADLPAERCRRRVADVLAEGSVLVVDPPTVLDAASRALLADIPGAILGLGEQHVSLVPRSEHELRDLFCGPDPVLHLRDDGARVLFAATGGHPAWIAETVGDWLDAGLARLVNGRVRLRRNDLPALEAGSSGSRTGHVGRFVQVLQDAEPEVIATRAVRLSDELVASGRFSAAVHALDTALATVRGRVGNPLEQVLIGHLVVSAYLAEDASLREGAAASVRRAAPERTGAGWLLDVAEASTALARRHFGVAEGLLTDLDSLREEPFEVARMTMLAEALVRGRPRDARVGLIGLEGWAKGDARRGRWAGWRGIEAYQAGRFVEAAAHHAEAGRLRSDPYGQLVAQVNEAMARLEVPELDAAAACARGAVRKAADLRLPGLELRAWTVVRGVAYRGARADAVDEALVEAAEQSDTAAAAPHLLLEGTIAWRAGNAAVAVRLLRAARQRYNEKSVGAIACEALLDTLGDDVGVCWEERLGPLRGARLGAQLWALLRRADRSAGPPPPLVGVDVENLDLRLEILSVREIRTVYDGAPGGA